MNASNQPSTPRQPECSICGKPVPIETAKTDEHARAVHETCYSLRMHLESASKAASAQRYQTEN